MAEAYCPRADAVARADCDAFLVCVHTQKAIGEHTASQAGQLALFGDPIADELTARFVEWDGIRAAIWAEKIALGIASEARA